MSLCEWAESTSGRERREGGRGTVSVVVYASLRGCVCRSAPYASIVVVEKGRTKDFPRYGTLVHLLAQLSYVHALMECYWNKPYQGAQWAWTSWHTVVTEARRKPKSRHHPKLFSFLGFFGGSSSSLSGKGTLLMRFQSLVLRVWRGHGCGLFVEGVAVDTDGREAVPGARGKSAPAACRR